MFRPSLKLKENRVTLASLEGVKAKRLLGALRTLWRSSKKYGQDDKITHLKSFLLPSPQREPRHAGDDDADDDAALEAVHDGDDGGAVAGGDDGEGGEPSPGSVSLSPSSNDVGDDTSIKGSSADDDLDGDMDEADGNVKGMGEPSSPNSSQDVPAEVGSSQDSSELNAPTLQLGEPSDAETSESETKSEDMRDSQVPGAGWLGRAMIHFRAEERMEQMMEKEEREIQRVLGFVRRDLIEQIDKETVDKGWEEYESLCRMAIRKQGSEAHGILAEPEFFFKWAFPEDPLGFLGLVYGNNTWGCSF